MNNVKEKDIVLVPRTGGGVSIGIVNICDKYSAQVCFPAGSTYRGERNLENTEEWGSKIVPIQELRPIPDGIKISFRKR